jgi:hypothetical protein
MLTAHCFPLLLIFQLTVFFLQCILKALLQLPYNTYHKQLATSEKICMIIQLPYNYSSRY